MEPTPPDIRDIVMPDADLGGDGGAILQILGFSIGLGLLAAAIVWLVLYLRSPRPPAIPPTPRDVAIGQLDELGERAAAGGASDLAEQLGRVVALYLHRQHGVPALYRTAVELSQQRSANDPPPLPELRRFAPLLDGIASLKFASPDRCDERAKEMIVAARSTIEGG